MSAATKATPRKKAVKKVDPVVAKSLKVLRDNFTPAQARKFEKALTRD